MIINFLILVIHFLDHLKEFEDERKGDIGEIFIYELSKSPQDEEMIDNDNEDIGSFSLKLTPNKIFIHV